MTDHNARAKWNETYRNGQAGDNEPARVLRENTHLLPEAGTALDLASGLGNNAICLARHGLITQAWDISDLAADKINQYAQENGLPLIAMARDIMATPPAAESFDVICVSHYLERSLTSTLINALRPGGLLLYQTFTQEVTVDYSGPKNPAFRLEPNELLRLFGSLRILFYREDGLIGNLNAGARNIAMLVAQKPNSR